MNLSTLKTLCVFFVAVKTSTAADTPDPTEELMVLHDSIDPIDNVLEIQDDLSVFENFQVVTVEETVYVTLEPATVYVTVTQTADGKYALPSTLKYTGTEGSSGEQDASEHFEPSLVVETDTVLDTQTTTTFLDPGFPMTKDYPVEISIPTYVRDPVFWTPTTPTDSAFSDETHKQERVPASLEAGSQVAPAPHSLSISLHRKTAWPSSVSVTKAGPDLPLTVTTPWRNAFPSEAEPSYHIPVATPVPRTGNSTGYLPNSHSVTVGGGSVNTTTTLAHILDNGSSSTLASGGDVVFSNSGPRMVLFTSLVFYIGLVSALL